VIVDKVYFTGKIFSCASVIVLLCAFNQSAYAEGVLYVSDQLSVPVRTGATNGHRIIKFFKSGAALSVIEMSEDEKYVHVELAGDKTGWVLADNLMDKPSARAQLFTANKNLQASRQKIKPLNKTIAELRTEIKQLKSENKTLKNESINLSNSLDDIKITAANPLSLSKKNKSLKRELEKAKDQVTMLDADNQQLRNNVTQEWFIIGGGVSMGSLILGLILTRINWRRKRDNWGDSF